MQAHPQRSVCRLAALDTSRAVESYSPSSQPLKKNAKSSGSFDFHFHSLSPSSVYAPIFFQQQQQLSNTPPPNPPKSVRFQTEAIVAKPRNGAASGSSRKRKLGGAITTAKKTIIRKVSHYKSEEGEKFIPNASIQLPVLTRRSLELEDFLLGTLANGKNKKRAQSRPSTPRLSDDAKLLLYLQRPDLDHQFRLAELIMKAGMKANCNLAVHLKIASYYVENILNDQMQAPCSDASKQMMTSLELYVMLKKAFGFGMFVPPLMVTCDR
jgi:hypothetical protein